MWPTKKLILWVIVTTLTYFTAPSTLHASDEETYFVATAYYSPLPGQSKYITGSYEWDIRLNGWGKVGASGKEVFPWMLAWPKNYPFGTKIYLEGYGIWEIADRWGAIVKAWERGYSYDRIDIWMGHGDEGLAKAIKWWKRTIKGKIVVPSSEVTLKLWESPLWYFDSLRVHPNSEGEDVKKLQEIFTKADLYTGQVDGEYQSIRNELIEFQIKNSVISGYADEEAGYFGPKSVAALKEKYSDDTPILVEEAKELFAQYNHRYASEKYKIILAYGDLVVEPESETEKILELQKLFTELWEYSGELDWKYESIAPSLIDLQKRVGLIQNDDDWGAGYFWNKTKSALWFYYEDLDSGEYELTQAEKTKMLTAYNTIRKRLKTAELKGGVKMNTQLSSLEKQIQSYIPKVTNRELKAKLEYLEELLQN